MDDQSWIHLLSDTAIAAIDSALSTLKSKGLAFPDFTKVDFPLPVLCAELSAYSDFLENGLGFLLLRGLPVDRYSEEDLNAIYYGIGLNLGQPVGQNPKGDLLGLVMNVGDVKDKNTRVYETNAYHPEFLALYYRPFYYAHLGKSEPGLSPIFSYHIGKLSCRYLRQYIELGHEIMGLPLSRVEVEALDIFDSIIHQESLRLDMMLEPGDLQFANNYAVLHSRTEFEDYGENERHRKMLRLWLKMPNARELAVDFPGRNGFPVPQSG